MSGLKWNDNRTLPEVNKDIVIAFYNDLGLYYAAGISTQTTDTKEIVFADVLAGHIYDWYKTVVKWAYLREDK